MIVVFACFVAVHAANDGAQFRLDIAFTSGLENPAGFIDATDFGKPSGRFREERDKD